MVTLKMLAERAGTSVSVVSAVINDSPHVRMSADTRERVLAEIKKANYVPNHAARSLRLARTQLLAVIIPSISRPVFEPLLDGIYAGAEESGDVVLLGDAGNLVSGSQLVERILGQGQVDGTLVRHSATLDGAIVDDLAARGAPLVVLDEVPDDRFTWVSLDEPLGCRVVTQHLLDLGHREIAFIGGVEAFSGTKRRLQGFSDAMRDAGCRVRDEWVIFGPQLAEPGYEAMSSLIASGPIPTAVVANNIVTGRGIASAALDAGIRIPQDLSIAAFHDLPGADVDRPALTTVSMPMRELGLAGVRMFNRLRAGESVESRMITDPPPRLIDRGSTAPLTGR